MAQFWSYLGLSFSILMVLKLKIWYRYIWWKLHSIYQKYSRLKTRVWWFIFIWSGSILQFRQDMTKVGSKSWLFDCSSNITLSLPSYTGPAVKRELNFCNSYLSPLYFWLCTNSVQFLVSLYLPWTRSKIIVLEMFLFFLSFFLRRCNVEAVFW